MVQGKLYIHKKKNEDRSLPCLFSLLFFKLKIFLLIFEIFPKCGFFFIIFILSNSSQIHSSFQIHPILCPHFSSPIEFNICPLYNLECVATHESKVNLPELHWSRDAAQWQRACTVCKDPGLNPEYYKQSQNSNNSNKNSSNKQQ